MKLSISKLLLQIILFSLIFNTSCKMGKEDTRGEIDLNTYNLDLPIDSLLNSGEYIYLDHSPITNSPFYYSYNTSLFRFTSIILEGDSLMKVSKRKPNTLDDDVFDLDEIVNKIELFPSTENSMDAILLTIEEPNTAKRIIKHFTDKNRIEEDDKIYLLHTEKRYIDDTEQYIAYLSIIKKDAKIGRANLLDLVNSYYQENELIQ